MSYTDKLLGAARMKTLIAILFGWCFIVALGIAVLFHDVTPALIVLGFGIIVGAWFRKGRDHA